MCQRETQGIGAGPEGYRTEKKDSTRAIGELTEMVGDAISAGCSSTDNVYTIKSNMCSSRC